MTAFGSSLRKLFRIHFLSPLFIVPLDYLPAFLLGAFLSSSCRAFYCQAFILPKCFDKFPQKAGPETAWVVGKFMWHRLSFGLWLV